MEDLKAKQEKAKAERVAQQNRQMEAQVASSNIRSNVMKSRPTKPKKEVVAVAPKSKALAALLARESPNGSIGMDGGGGGGSGRSSHGGFHSSLSSSGSMLRSSGSMGSPSRQVSYTVLREAKARTWPSSRRSDPSADKQRSRQPRPATPTSQSSRPLAIRPKLSAQ